MRITNEIKNYIFKRIDTRASVKREALQKELNNWEKHSALMNKQLKEDINKEIDKWAAKKECPVFKYIKKYPNTFKKYYDDYFTEDTFVDRIAYEIKDSFSIKYVCDEEKAARKALEDFDTYVEKQKEEFLFKLLTASKYEEIVSAIDEIQF